ncbi:hypothetical protein M378DRAFT_435100 [Amanita muscaria Koide BX008]|uniref:Uncharacterized protein n=1 Tax=Amanita muscaria (strain Koide BX008) TaxID=946122 RepID=A0A0C2S2K5_AMAMK|nr:hypothetical protein M378DRAFT_435100 [Amanita muscaria Koide BX008]
MYKKKVFFLEKCRKTFFPLSFVPLFSYIRVPLPSTHNTHVQSYLSFAGGGGGFGCFRVPPLHSSILLISCFRTDCFVFVSLFSKQKKRFFPTSPLLRHHVSNPFPHIYELCARYIPRPLRTYLRVFILSFTLRDSCTSHFRIYSIRPSSHALPRSPYGRSQAA